jgi:hypothetical protein
LANIIGGQIRRSFAPYRIGNFPDSPTIYAGHELDEYQGRGRSSYRRSVQSNSAHSEDSPLGRFADGEMISFDEETLYELANRDYGLDVWALGPSHAAHEMKEDAVDGNSPMQAGTAAIAAIMGRAQIYSVRSGLTGFLRCQ